jgi:hypothetical protein
MFAKWLIMLQPFSFFLSLINSSVKLLRSLEADICVRQAGNAILWSVEFWSICNPKQHLQSRTAFAVHVQRTMKMLEFSQQVVNPRMDIIERKLWAENQDLVA